MQKDKRVKIILISIMVMVCGILYSCNTNTMELTQNDSESILSEENIENVEANTEKDLDFDDTQKDTDNSEKVSDAIIYVYVCGQVNNPGVYELHENARIYEAIEAAGGINPEGSKDYLNQAQVVKDGDRVFVPSIEEAELMKMDTGGFIEENTSDAEGSSESGLININTASDSELMNLPGIGQSKADKIIAYRESNGGFDSIEDIMQITGIKEGVYNKIKDLITVN